MQMIASETPDKRYDKCQLHNNTRFLSELVQIPGMLTGDSY